MEKDNTKELGQIVKDLLEVMKLQQNMHDRLHNQVNIIDENLQKQISNLQEQIKLLAKAGVKVTEGFEQLHKTALGDPYPKQPEKEKDNLSAKADKEEMEYSAERKFEDE